jgi:ABC-2 type transport system ATP-binding protein
VLVLNNLRKVYGSLIAVEGTTLSLGPGDVFGFIGPNGAGKTTTIKMLATLITPTSGTAEIDGIDVTTHPLDIRPLIGYMPDSFGLYEDIKVWEYLDFFAAAYRIPKSDRPSIIDDILDLTNLTVKKDSYVLTLSRGMQQRLCLAKCIVHGPKVLLLDEPASALDPRARFDIKQLIIELGKKGKTIIVSSHILPELADFCNKIGIMEHGKMLVCDSVDNIIEQLQPTRRIAIKTAGSTAALLAVITEFPNVISAVLPAELKDTIVVDFQGGIEAEAELLKMLIASGQPVCSFHELALDLEDVFMHFTLGNLQ